MVEYVCIKEVVYLKKDVKCLISHLLNVDGQESAIPSAPILLNICSVH